MFKRTKEKPMEFVFGMEQVLAYFKEKDFKEVNYKLSEQPSDDEKITKEIKRCLENVEWMKGFQHKSQVYLIYHSENTISMKTLFKKYTELSRRVTGKKGHYNKANDEIENFVVRDEEQTTLYMIRVGSDIIKVLCPVEQEEEMKQVLKELNSFVYKREK